MTLWERMAPELVTDLYEVTMAASYLREGMHGTASFSLYVRTYPEHRGYFVSAGLDHLCEMIENFRFCDESVAYLASLGKFDPAFLQYLRGARFTGSVRAIPEGRLFFAEEPILEVTGPIIEAQLVETLSLNTLHLESLIASKAARCVHAAGGRHLADFSPRRTQGAEASLKVARASYLAGFAGTSNLLAGSIYGIPVYGTMAHSFVASFPREREAFHAYARAFPDETVLLIDTYETLCGAEKAVEVARLLRGAGKRLRAVRLDSGDLPALTRSVRGVLDGAGFPDVAVMVSGNLDEFKLEELIRAGAVFDLAGIGTALGVSADAPSLDMAYKLVEYDGRPILKLSPGKRSLVGRKQVFRRIGEDGLMAGDTLGLAGEVHPEARPLLETVIENGRRVRPPESLSTIRERFEREFSTLPEAVRATTHPARYPVTASPGLLALQDATAEARRREESCG